jgi:hypothetical protein
MPDKPRPGVRGLDFVPNANIAAMNDFNLLAQQQLSNFPSPPKVVWLIMPDNSSEGLGEPIVAYANEARANEAMELLGHTASRFKLVSLKITA